MLSSSNLVSSVLLLNREKGGMNQSGHFRGEGSTRCVSTDWAKEGLSSSSSSPSGERARRGGDFTVGMNGERDLGLRRGGGERDLERDLERDFERDLERSVDGDLGRDHM